MQLDYQSQTGSSSSVVLYLGLSLSSVGLVIFLVGVGDKGFKSLELQLIGPSLIGETPNVVNNFCGKLFMPFQWQSIRQYFLTIFCLLTLKIQNLFSGIGLLMSFFQILYCSKPWKHLSCCCSSFCVSQPQEDLRIAEENSHLNSAVIKIRSYNEFTRPQSRHQLGTISEFSTNSSIRRPSLGGVDG